MVNKPLTAISGVTVSAAAMPMLDNIPRPC